MEDSEMMLADNNSPPHGRNPRRGGGGSGSSRSNPTRSQLRALGERLKLNLGGKSSTAMNDHDNLADDGNETG